MSRARHHTAQGTRATRDLVTQEEDRGGGRRDDGLDQEAPRSRIQVSEDMCHYGFPLNGVHRMIIMAPSRHWRWRHPCQRRIRAAQAILKHRCQ